LKLALLRHGPTGWNALGRIQGHTDIPLSDEGLAKMRGLLPPPSFAQARAFASPLLRARQTAEALGLTDPTLDARLMEQNWGNWEGLSRAENPGARWRGCVSTRGPSASLSAPGGESTEELHDRVAAFLKDVARENSDAIAVAHMGVLRAAYTLASGWDMSAPMPPDLDISKALILGLTDKGVPAIAELNVELPVKT